MRAAVNARIAPHWRSSGHDQPMCLILRLLCSLFLAGNTLVSAQTVRIENAFGGITARVASENLQIRTSSPTRRPTALDTKITEKPDLVDLKVQPADGARIDIEVVLPYGASFEARTTAGPIRLRGFFGPVGIATESGEISIEAPWEASRLYLTAASKPAQLSLPGNSRFEPSRGRGGLWILEDRLPDDKITHGRFEVSTLRSTRVELREMPIPENSPVKLPWQAPQVLEALAADAPPPRPSPGKQPSATSQPGATAATAGEAIFSSSVHLVGLTAAVYDRQRRPMAGLAAEDFVVTEDGVRQEIESAAAEGVGFNLVLLFDLSGSTKQSREPMKQAALRFLEVARPQDRVSVHLLANNRFYVVSPLTDDREKLRGLIESFPELSGGTPLYDTIVLSYAQELSRRRGERNAIIILSDGIDNQLYGRLTPSRTSFEKLVAAVREFDTLIYPVLLGAGETGRNLPRWAHRTRDRMAELAAASGGRVFPAKSIEDLEPVYPQVENELRAVYTITYYPKNQDFNGKWRPIEVRVNRPGAQVRTREGYVARP